MIRRILTGLLLAGVVGAALLAGLVAWLNQRGEEPLPAGLAPAAGSAEQVRRGEYLAKAGNCAGCHTLSGAAPFTGGRGVDTPFGTVFAPNLTPDDETGLGRWNAAEFWRALHNGRSRDGRLLYPAFPYPNYTHVTREDSDAIYAYLRTLPPVRQATPAHTVGFPYNTQPSLAVWRAMFFRPGQLPADPAQTAEWNRGAYLVQGLGHCNACHSARNALGGTAGVLDLSGGLIPMQNWYAPSLNAHAEAGVADWEIEHIVALLRDGVSPTATVMGPMAEVVFNSTQHLSPADLRAMATYLKALPQTDAPIQRVAAPAAAVAGDDLGARLYSQNCAVCHGSNGEGVPGAYPALAGNRAVTMEPTANLVRVLLMGGYAPATHGNPRPYGMPPFSTDLTPEQASALLTYIRTNFGNRARPVPPVEVHQYRSQ